VANLLVLSIVKLAVAGQHPLHDSRDRIVAHLDQQMKMVRHEAVSVQIEGQSGFLLLEYFEKSEIVGVGAEDLSAIIAARNDVIEAASQFDAWFPGHGGSDAIQGSARKSRTQA